MIPLLLAVLVLAVDPMGFEPAALKRAILLSFGPLLFLAAWRDGSLKRLATASLSGPLVGIAALHAWAFLGASATAFASETRILLIAGTGSLLLLVLVALRAREDAVAAPFRLGDTAIALGVVAAGYAIAQRAGFDPIFQNPARAAVSFFGNTNRAAEYLAPIVPLAVVFRSARRGFPRFLATLAIPLATGALLLTNSRAGLLAAGAGTALALLASRRRSGAVGLDLLLLLLGACLPFAIAGKDGYSLKSVEESTESIASPSYEPNRQRALLYSATLEMIADRPLLGHGSGTFRLTFPAYRDPEEARMKTLGGALSSAEDPHDEFLRLAAESGAPAAILFALFLLLALLAARDAALWPQDHPLRSAAPGHAAALVSLGVVSLFRSTLDHAPVAVLIVALGGALAACRERGRDSALGKAGFIVLPIHLLVIAIVGFRLLIGEFFLGAGERALRRPETGAAIRAIEKLELGRAFDPTNLAILQREAVLEEARARVDSNRVGAAVDARRRILALDPLHVTSNLRLAARLLEAGDRPGARRHLALAQRALGEKGHDASVSRLREQKEDRAAARLELAHALDGGQSLADLRLDAEQARRDGDPTYAIHLLEAFLEARPADGDAASELGDALTAAGARDLAENAYLRAHVCRAAAALARDDRPSAKRSIESARRHGRLFEVEALAALLGASEGDSTLLDELSATKRQGRPASWFVAAIEPLRARATLSGALERLGL